MEIQPEVKEQREGRERREREKDKGGARVPRNQAERLVREAGPRNWPEKLAPILYCSEGLLYF